MGSSCVTLRLPALSQLEALCSGGRPSLYVDRAEERPDASDAGLSRLTLEATLRTILAELEDEMEAGGIGTGEQLQALT